MKSVFCRDMRVAIYGVPAQTQQGGLRGARRGKGEGGVFAARLAETEQGGLCPDDFSAHKRASPALWGECGAGGRNPIKKDLSP